MIDNTGSNIISGFQDSRSVSTNVQTNGEGASFEEMFDQELAAGDDIVGDDDVLTTGSKSTGQIARFEQTLTIVAFRATTINREINAAEGQPSHSLIAQLMESIEALIELLQSHGKPEALNEMTTLLEEVDEEKAPMAVTTVTAFFAHFSASTEALPLENVSSSDEAKQSTLMLQKQLIDSMSMFSGANSRIKDIFDGFKSNPLFEGDAQIQELSDNLG
ncbi:hypothetical protein HOH87_04235 [bacterium]|jgi:hypothetical protein|nr:hypothetical protein [bacterium]